MKVAVLYFASLRDAAGVPGEAIVTKAPDLSMLYEELRARYRFELSREQLRVAVDGEFAPWTDPLHEGAEIAFIPPVSGG